jgi:hypothetical protein
MKEVLDTILRNSSVWEEWGMILKQHNCSATGIKTENLLNVNQFVTTKQAAQKD